MNRMLVALVAVLACIGTVTSQQPPQGPWQSLTPSVAQGSNPHRDDIALTDEEEFLVSNIPFKLPFKMNKKQTAVAMKLLKEAVKPVIKSKTLQDTVTYLDDLLAYYIEDRASQLYMSFVLDLLQDVYEGKQSERVDKIVRGLIHDNSDEVTARTIDDMWSYMSRPVNEYFFGPVRSYVFRPIGNAVSDFAERIGTWMGTPRRPKTPTSPYQESSYASWSNTVNDYARRLSHWTRQARMSLAYAADVLESQDQHARSSDVVSAQ